MQTFLPDRDFRIVSDTLDPSRHNKQTVETYQILNILLARTPSEAWVNHPAVRMWRGYEPLLQSYQNTLLYGWLIRGGNSELPFEEEPSNIDYPVWWNDERVFLSHRCNLVRKDPEYYGQFAWPDIDIDAPYFWPCGLKDEAKHKLMIDYWGGML